MSKETADCFLVMNVDSHNIIMWSPLVLHHPPKESSLGTHTFQRLIVNFEQDHPLNSYSSLFARIHWEKGLLNARLLNKILRQISTIEFWQRFPLQILQTNHTYILLLLMMNLTDVLRWQESSLLTLLGPQEIIVTDRQSARIALGWCANSKSILTVIHCDSRFRGTPPWLSFVINIAYGGSFNTRSLSYRYW